MARPATLARRNDMTGRMIDIRLTKDEAIRSISTRSR